ncbi:MAG: hypothetical protein COB76_04755 [Alphaproteobacteria bacterium]|nr:MAG: hypothetical protein COB76_04755 [Alphaproteobacteria bacterium]
MMKTTYTQKGNVLFLILIAVALFAALSYAVTQSSRSGGDAGRETNMINSAVLTQYPASLRISVMRLVIEGVAVERQQFNDPEVVGFTDRLSAFHPDGGGAVYQQTPADIMNDGNPGTWAFNMDFEITGLGSSAAGISGNELVAFLVGVTQSVCQKINDEASIGGIPITVDLSASYVKDQIHSYDFSGVGNVDLDGTAGDAGDLHGKAFGCFQNTATGDYVFYSALYER